MWVPKSNGKTTLAATMALCTTFTEEVRDLPPGPAARGGGQHRSQSRYPACTCDPHALSQLAQRVRNDGYPMLKYRATTLNFSKPTKHPGCADARRLERGGSPVARWCIGKVVGHYDRRGNIYPNKARNEAKIDRAIATIMAPARLNGDRSAAGPSYRERSDRKSVV